MKTFAVFIFGMGLLFAGCGKKPADEAAQELIVYCGAGLRLPMSEMIQAFEQQNRAKIAVDYAGSEMLLGKITLAMRGDVYIPGDKHYVDQADEKGWVTGRKMLCYFVPVILVAQSNPKRITALGDLMKPNIRLGLGDPNACAIGRKTWKILNKNGISQDDLHENLIYQSLTVNDLGVQVKTGNLDVAIVWDAVAAQYADVTEQVEIPTEHNVISTIEGAVLSFSEHKELAARFVDFLASDKGRAIFQKYHYTVEQP